PDTFAPPRKQISPALMTTPPTTVPESTPLHSVAAIAPSLPTASAKPTIPTKKPASVFIVDPLFDFATPRLPGAERSVAECLLEFFRASTATGDSQRRAPSTIMVRAMI